MKLPVAAAATQRNVLVTAAPPAAAGRREVLPTGCLGVWCACPSGDHVCCQDGQTCNNNPPPHGQCQCV
jgi:hypothetical protein